ncbi:EAL and HDOD domain-containing protein [Massilia sp. TS11]|uniref:EAL and HDOD domain-containing protein n=1 Tax=Massilia sp. TS11 TaxID=2908003 RepID=UPI001EDB0714|nr:EAL domain-containing protein [Massilia sp. TS11]MCG2583371.1 EAL domain-containing protein [Massilia sp. TS11]
MSNGAPAATAEPEKLSDDFFLARQPILGRDQMLVAFELLFRSANVSTSGVTDDATATASVISHAAQLGMDHVVGQNRAFVNVDAVVLQSDFIRFLDHEKVILEILETVKATDEVIARVRELKELGFVFALDDVISASEDVKKLLPLVDVIKVDLMGVNEAQLTALARVFKGSGKKLLAEKVETRKDFETCKALGFDYFQGYYFARPVVLTGKKIAPSQMAIMGLLDLINSDADTKDIELAVKRDPLISMNLLRLVNTPAAGVSRKIDSVAQALMVLGRKQLQRWLQILLYAQPGGNVEFTSPLLQLATTRGKLLELIVLEVTGKKQQAETAFTVGIMSLMDTLFSMSMPDILNTVAVTDEVREALVSRGGQLGDMLTLIELLEGTHKSPQLKDVMDRLGLSPVQVRDIQLAAFNWVTELSQEVQ